MEIRLLVHFAFAAQLALGVVFLLSAWPKMRQRQAFARSVAAYEILPEQIAYPFALGLIAVEALLTASFLTGFATDIALPLAFVLLFVFLVAVGVNLKRGRRISCSCFGDASERISPRTVVRLLLLMGMVAFVTVVKGTSAAPVPNLSSIFTNGSALYLMQAMALAAFLLILGAWVLTLPELMLIAHHGRQVQPSRGASPQNGMED